MEVNMRKKGGTNKYWSTEEKVKIVDEMINNYISLPEMSKKTGIAIGQLWTWRDKYQKNGKTGLVNSRKPGNPLSKYSSKKKLTKLEQLQYENMKLRIENERLKKGYMVEGVGLNKVFISLRNKNMK